MSDDLEYWLVKGLAPCKMKNKCNIVFQFLMELPGMLKLYYSKFTVLEHPVMPLKYQDLCSLPLKED